MILKEKIKEIWTIKHKGNPFGPWVTHNPPPLPGSDEIFQTQKVPDINPIILKEKYKEIRTKNTKETHLTPEWHTKTPWGGSDKIFQTQNLLDIIHMILKEKN